MRIDYGKQNIFDGDIYFTANSLKKNFLTQGNNVLLFEKKIKNLFSKTQLFYY